MQFSCNSNLWKLHTCVLCRHMFFLVCWTRHCHGNHILLQNPCGGDYFTTFRWCKLNYWWPWVVHLCTQCHTKKRLASPRQNYSINPQAIHVPRGIAHLQWYMYFFFYIASEKLSKLVFILSDFKKFLKEYDQLWLSIMMKFTLGSLSVADNEVHVHMFFSQCAISIHLLSWKTGYITLMVVSGIHYTCKLSVKRNLYHFFRVTFTEIHCIKIIHIWTQIR